MSSIEEAANNEIARLKEILTKAGVSGLRREVLDSIIENVAWMKVKLIEARETIKTSTVVIPYDNGGGQSGLRENPLFKGYESLWKSYMTGMSRIIDALPPEEGTMPEMEDMKPKTVLELVRDKHRKDA